MDILTKRKAYEDQQVVPSTKRARDEQHGGRIMTASGPLMLPLGVNRTSHLLAPIIELSGHEAEVFCGKFSSGGEMIATGGMDRCVYYWNTYDENENYALLRGHQGVVLDLQFAADDYCLYTASTDKTIGVWDVESGCKIKRIKGHQAYVNSVSAARRGPPLLVSGSDDNTARTWDCRRRGQIKSYQCMYQVTSVCYNDSSEMIFTAGIDNEIKMWDTRKNSVVYSLKGHRDTVTGISLSPDGSFLLSNGMDNTLRIWDVRPYAPQERLVHTLHGHQHTFEKNLLKCCWSPDGTRVSCGSGDRFVYIWNTKTCQLQYKLPGHRGSVNETAFHPKEPIILSVSTDRIAFLGEIQPH